MTSIDSMDRDTTLARLYEEHRQPLLRRLVQLTGDRATAEDLYQETFVKVVRHWAQHNPESNIGAWLYRIATNTAYDYLRSCRRERLVQLSEGVGSPPIWSRNNDDLNEQVQAALAKLPSHYRIPLLLRIYIGHSLEEIAATLGCSCAAAKSRLFRARACFRRVYQV